MSTLGRIRVVVFPSDLGWIATAWREHRLHRLTFAHTDPQAAVKVIGADEAEVVPPNRQMEQLTVRLQAFARGLRDDEFEDVVLDTEGLTEFQRAVIKVCRQILCGHTMSYGDLARAAGYSGAARAVGSVMANNRWPLIIPCHRVVSAQGLGGFSARQGLWMKRRLLSFENGTESQCERASL